ncbi:MAG: alpha/beta hydrolase [bacterium]|jgi:branched-chain amino acid transport system permease protein
MTGQRISILGIDIYYVSLGTGFPIVYVHGNTGSSRWFEKVADIPGYRTIALDLPNFGRSGALGAEPDIHRYADYLLAFIKALNLEPPVLVGHSLGGAVAQSLAVRNPEALSAMVLVDSSSPTGLITPRERHPVIEIMRTNRGILAQALAATLPTNKDAGFFEYLIDDAVRMNEKAWIGNAEALSRFDISGLTTSFAKPVLVVQGKADILITEEMARKTAEAYPAGEFRLIENSGHSPIVEVPELFKEILSDFLGRIMG